jgi:hypothetical protein
MRFKNQISGFAAQMENKIIGHPMLALVAARVSQKLKYFKIIIPRF